MSMVACNLSSSSDDDGGTVASRRDCDGSTPKIASETPGKTCSQRSTKYNHQPSSQLSFATDSGHGDADGVFLPAISSSRNSKTGKDRIRFRKINIGSSLSPTPRVIEKHPKHRKSKDKLQGKQYPPRQHGSFSETSENNERKGRKTAALLSNSKKHGSSRTGRTPQSSSSSGIYSEQKTSDSDDESLDIQVIQSSETGTQPPRKQKHSTGVGSQGTPLNSVQQPSKTKKKRTTSSNKAKRQRRRLQSLSTSKYRRSSATSSQLVDTDEDVEPDAPENDENSVQVLMRKPMESDSQIDNTHASQRAIGCTNNKKRISCSKITTSSMKSSSCSSRERKNRLSKENAGEDSDSVETLPLAAEPKPSPSFSLAVRPKELCLPIHTSSDNKKRTQQRDKAYASFPSSSPNTEKHHEPAPKKRRIAKDILKVGDRISYYHPAFVAGNPMGFRDTTILAVTPIPLNASDDVDYFPLELDNAEVLPADTRVKKFMTGRERPIDEFVLIEGSTKSNDGRQVSGLQRQGERMKSFLRSANRALSTVPEHLQDLNQFRDKGSSRSDSSLLLDESGGKSQVGGKSKENSASDSSSCESAPASSKVCRGACPPLLTDVLQRLEKRSNDDSKHSPMGGSDSESSTETPTVVRSPHFAHLNMSTKGSISGQKPSWASELRPKNDNRSSGLQTTSDKRRTPRKTGTNNEDTMPSHRLFTLSRVKSRHSTSTSASQKSSTSDCLPLSLQNIIKPSSCRGKAGDLKQSPSKTSTAEECPSSTASDGKLIENAAVMTKTPGSVRSFKVSSLASHGHQSPTKPGPEKLPATAPSSTGDLHRSTSHSTERKTSNQTQGHTSMLKHSSPCYSTSSSEDFELLLREQPKRSNMARNLKGSSCLKSVPKGSSTPSSAGSSNFLSVSRHGRNSPRTTESQRVLNTSDGQTDHTNRATVNKGTDKPFFLPESPSSDEWSIREDERPRPTDTMNEEQEQRTYTKTCDKVKPGRHRSGSRSILRTNCETCGQSSSSAEQTCSMHKVQGENTEARKDGKASQSCGSARRPPLVDLSSNCPSSGVETSFRKKKKRKSSFGARAEARRRNLALPTGVEESRLETLPLDMECLEDDDDISAFSGPRNNVRGKDEDNVRSSVFDPSEIEPADNHVFGTMDSSSDEDAGNAGKRQSVLSRGRLSRRSNASLDSSIRTYSQGSNGTFSSSSPPSKHRGRPNRTSKDSLRRLARMNACIGVAGNNRRPGGLMPLKLKPVSHLSCVEEDEFL